MNDGLRIGQRRMNQHHAIAVIHAVITRPQVSARQLIERFILFISIQDFAQNHPLRLTIIHRADAVKCSR